VSAALVSSLVLLAGAVHAQQDLTPRAMDLPTSKLLITPTPAMLRAKRSNKRADDDG
jgi:hypothetical protein